MNKEFALPPRRRYTLKEKRRNAELEHVRVDFADNNVGRVGLWTAHKDKENDVEMRWLAELFPLKDAHLMSREHQEKRLSEWCEAHPDDARALVYLSYVRDDVSVMEKAAALGDARAMAECFSLRSDDEMFRLACASAVKNDALGVWKTDGMFSLWSWLQREREFCNGTLETCVGFG